MSECKIKLLDVDRDGLRAFVAEMGEKPFRADQIMKWIYHFGADDFTKMTNINRAMQAKLSECAYVKAPEIKAEYRSSDGTIKWALDAGDGQLIETVYIPDGDRATLCVSTQVGCVINCAFCATGAQGFNRNLSTSEIIGQVWRATSVIGFTPNPKFRAIDNVVLMGMGEPLLNFDNTVRAMKIMLDDFGFGLSKRRVTISTAGVVPGIDRLGDAIDVALAISLHAPNDELRSKLIPLNDKHNISSILAAVKRYVDKSNANSGRVTIEYILLAGVNDRPEHAHELAKLLANTPCKINLIPFNPHEAGRFSKPKAADIDRFYRILLDYGYTVVTRKTRGDDIKAACGQLAGEVKNKLKKIATFSGKDL